MSSVRIDFKFVDCKFTSKNALQYLQLSQTGIDQIIAELTIFEKSYIVLAMSQSAKKLTIALIIVAIAFCFTGIMPLICIALIIWLCINRQSFYSTLAKRVKSRGEKMVTKMTALNLPWHPNFIIRQVTRQATFVEPPPYDIYLEFTSGEDTGRSSFPLKDSKQLHSSESSGKPSDETSRHPLPLGTGGSSRFINPQSEEKNLETSRRAMNLAELEKSLMAEPSREYVRKESEDSAQESQESVRGKPLPIEAIQVNSLSDNYLDIHNGFHGGSPQAYTFGNTSPKFGQNVEVREAQGSNEVEYEAVAVRLTQKRKIQPTTVVTDPNQLAVLPRPSHRREKEHVISFRGSDQSQFLENGSNFYSFEPEMLNQQINDAANGRQIKLADSEIDDNLCRPGAIRKESKFCIAVLPVQSEKQEPRSALLNKMKKSAYPVLKVRSAENTSFYREEIVSEHSIPTEHHNLAITKENYEKQSGQPFSQKPI